MSPNDPTHRNRAVALFISYGLTVLLVAVAAAIRWGLDYSLGPTSPFLTFYPALMLAALIWGLGPGLAATGLGAIVADYLFIPPAWSLAITNLRDGVALAIFCFVGVFICVITDRLRAARVQQATWQSEEKLRLWVEGAQDYAFFTMDEKGYVVSWNAGAERIKGWRSQEILGQHVSRLYPQELIDQGQPQRELEIAAATGQYHEEGRRLRKDGSLFWADITITALRDAEGRLRGFAKLARDITERKQMEEELLRSRDELEVRVQERTEALRRQADLIELSHEAIIVRDLESRILFWNRGAEETYGFTGAEAEGNITHSLLKTRFPVPFEEHMAALTTEGRWEGELIHTRKDGSELIVLSRQVLQRDEAGAPIGTMEINIDITDRKRAEIALQASEQRWATTLTSIGDAVISTDLSGNITFMNAVAEDLTGWTLGNAMHKPITEVFHIINEQTRLEVENPISKVLREGMIIGLANHTLLVKKDGTEIPIDDSGAPIRDKEGNIAGVVLIFRDIIERKEAEKALSLASAYNRRLIEASIDPLVTINPDGRISDVNAATEQATGHSRDELIGTDFCDYFTDPRKARAGYEMVFKEGLVRDYPLEIRHRNGHITTVLYNASVYRDDTGSVIGVFAAARDVSEQQKLEVQLRQAQKMEALGTLSGGIAHDFNNILAAIVGFTELLSGHIEKGSRDAHRIERIMEAAIRGRELVEQMLAFSRKTEQVKKPLRVSSIVNETVKLIRATTPTTISIEVNTISESDLILGDPTQIQQVLMNLCTNAAYAMREKGGSLGIDLNDFSVSASDGNPVGIAPGLYVKLIVRDTGTGIPAGIMDKIFDPFFTTKKLGEGTGLGLSVVHGIVKQHDGYITVETEPGRGTTFTVYLPKLKGETETGAVHEDDIPTGCERILFVDDEESLVEMGEDVLAELGYEVTSRMNGRQALALLKGDPSRFDLVITDQTMPEMTGIELAKEILAIRADMPIIMCTGFSYVVDADKAKAAGIKAFAMKPLTKREIAKTIRKVLDE